MFLLPADEQRSLIEKVASRLHPGGHFLFTAPSQVCEWVDTLTGRVSRSLGEDAYVALLSSAGVVVRATFVDEGKNDYIHGQKPLVS